MTSIHEISNALAVPLVDVLRQLRARTRECDSYRELMQLALAHARELDHALDAERRRNDRLVLRRRDERLKRINQRRTDQVLDRRSTAA